MANRTGSRVVYAAGLVQGVALVTFPAASTIFTDPRAYGLSRGAFGLTVPALNTFAAEFQPGMFGLTAAVAAAMGALSFAVTRGRREPASLHPRPARAGT